MFQYFFYFFRVGVEVSQRLVTQGVSYVFQVAGQFFGQRAYGYVFEFAVYDDGVGGQVLQVEERGLGTVSEYVSQFLGVTGSMRILRV